jgi:glucose-1-phosphate cytidylyltransferase
MKAVILAGGLGTRISEETHLRPKPMVEIGGKPILWHIMKIYAHHGVTDFIVCCGYKAQVIKEYFANYHLHNADVTFDLSNGTVDFHRSRTEPWRVTLVDTGESTATGGRLKRVRDRLDLSEPFCFTYGDGVADVPVADVIRAHRAHGKLVTVTAVQSPARWGALVIEGDRVNSFAEKSAQAEGAWINGGFFVVDPKAIDYIEGDTTAWELDPLSTLASKGELVAHRHAGFWQAMDTLREKNMLEQLWASGQAPWKVWAE